MLYCLQMVHSFFLIAYQRSMLKSNYASSEVVYDMLIVRRKKDCGAKFIDFFDAR